MRPMTDQELDRLMRRVLIDSLTNDEASMLEEVSRFVPSKSHQRQMRGMLKEPVKWLKNKAKPIWKKVAERVAVILLIASISLGGLMAVSPTVRAAVIRWVTEWYETHIVYRFSGESIDGEMPEYEIAGIPEAFVETDRIESGSTVSIFYEDHSGGIICFDYLYMHQGASTIVTMDDNMIDVTVNGLQGQLFLPTDVKNTTTIVWIDPQANIQFAIDTTLGESDIMHMAESVILLKSTE